MLLGVAAVILGGFLIICAAPFTKSCLYKAGGGLFLIAGELNSATVFFLCVCLCICSQKKLSHFWFMLEILPLHAICMIILFSHILLGIFMLLATVLFVIWLEVLDVVDLYVKDQKSHCPGFKLNIMYGLSFMFAPVGVFFSLLAGLFFLLIGRAIKNHCY